MKLYDAVWAPSPRRVRIFLAEKRIDVDRELVDLRSDAHRSPEFLALNPRGTVPALLLDDGIVIGESSAICRYFEALHPDPPLFGTTPLEIATIEAWTRRIEDDGYAAVGHVLRNTIPAFAGRAISGTWPEMPQIAELAERGRCMWPVFLNAVDARLEENEWIAGGGYSFADIVLVVALDFGKPARLPPATERPAIARWRAAVEARPSTHA